MNETPQEVTDFHSRLLRCSLEVENSRAYWKHASSYPSGSKAKIAFENYWFGSKSMARVQTLVRQFEWQFNAIPQSLEALASWDAVDADTRRLVCHWNLQFTDPLYRGFTGTFLPSRIESGRNDLTKDIVVRWIEATNLGQWQTRTRMRIATNLFHAASGAGLIESSRDPRTAKYCPVTDLAISYLMHVLRETEYEGTITTNPYFKSVGLEHELLASRLKSLSSIEFKKQGDLVDFGWKYDSFSSWADSLQLAPVDQIREAS